MRIVLSILSIIFFVSCNSSQRKISNWTEEEKELIFKDGELVSRQVGVAPKKTYEDAINAAL